MSWLDWIVAQVVDISLGWATVPALFLFFFLASKVIKAFERKPNDPA